MRTATRKRGPQPRPRLRLNQPTFRRAVHDSGHRLFHLAKEIGFSHDSQFSAFINAKLVPETPVNIERLYRIADAVGFDREELFLDGGAR